MTLLILLPAAVRAQETPTRVIRALAYSPGGESIAVAAAFGKTGELTLLDARTQAVKWRHAQTQVCRDIVWLDGDRLAAAVGTSLVLFDAFTGRVGKTLGKHEKFLMAIAASRDGKTLVSASHEDKTVKLWDVVKGEERKSVTLPEVIDQVNLSPDGKRVVVAAHERVHLLDVTTGKEVASFDPGHYGPYAGFSPDGKEILTATWDGYARIWDAKTTNRTYTLSGLGGLDGVVLLAKTQTLVMWNRRGIRVLSFDRRPPDAAMAKRIDALLTQLDDDDFAIRDKAEDALRQIGFVAEPMLRAAREAKSAEVRLRARRILRYLRTDSGTVITSSTRLRAVTFSPDGKSLACGGDDGLVRLYDAITGKPLASK